MAVQDQAPPVAPADAAERERQDNLHPLQGNPPVPERPYQLLVIGAGSAGLAAAEEAAALGVRVALVERELLGGACVNNGGVPSKTLLATSRLYARMRDANRFGGRVPQDIVVDFAAVMQRVRDVRSHLSGQDSVCRLKAAGVDVYFGAARFVGADRITIDGATLVFEQALIATGARPNVPKIPGLEQAGYLTNENVFELTELPQRLLVIGGGPLGCELAQAFCRLGARTTIVQDMPLFLDNEERDAAQILSDAFARDGIEVRLNTRVAAVRAGSNGIEVDLVSDDYANTIVVDRILTGIGRTPDIEDLDLDVAGVAFDRHRGVTVDDFLRTSNPRIFAAGDVCLEHKYTHTATASAHIVVQNALFAGRERLSKLVVPWCTYTDPEIAHVGLYVREANRRDIPVKTFTVPMHTIDRAVTDADDAGFVKIHVREGSDTILGATIVSGHAGDMINEITLAMVAGIGLRKLGQVIHAYPTQAEGIRKAADAYNRTRFTERIRGRLRRWLSR